MDLHLPIKPFPHEIELRNALRRGGETEMKAVSAKIYKTHLEPVRSFMAAVEIFIRVCFQIDEVKKRAMGIKSPTFKSNRIQTAVGNHLLSGKVFTNFDLNLVQAFKEMVEKSGFSDAKWITVKIMNLIVRMQHVLNTEHFISSLAIDYDTSESSIESLRRDIREVMDRLLELRRYGIKSSFLPYGLRSAWVMWDFKDFVEGLSGIPRNNQISVIGMAQTASQISDLKPIIEDQKGSIQGLALPFDCSFVWTMDREGELNLDCELGVIPVRNIFTRKNKELQYEVVRGKLVSHLYDLIVPVSIVTPNDVSGRIIHPKKRFELITIKPKSPIQDLFLPRIRQIENVDSVRIELEKEFEAADQETAERRKIRQHEVVAHIRKLPRGHKPSLLARQKAIEDFGIVLGENETYVRKHIRGSGDMVRGHRAKKRQTGST